LIAILDYGSGNLRSAQRAFERAHPDVVITTDAEVCAKADGLVVPGVGAYAACMEQLVNAGGERIIKDRVAVNKPIFGICVGAQILFEQGDEKTGHVGLGIFNGSVTQITAPVLPHIGWNTVIAPSSSKLFAGVADESFYFVHSYAAKADVRDAITTRAEYGESFVAAVERGSIVATQFHPEKSGDAGARVISNWVSGWAA
jgi:glutamine amidotransferase